MLEAEFYKLFGRGVTREMIPDSVDDEQIKNAMKECITTKKDNLLQLLGIDVLDDVLY